MKIECEPGFNMIVRQQMKRIQLLDVPKLKYVGGKEGSSTQFGIRLFVKFTLYFREIQK